MRAYIINPERRIIAEIDFPGDYTHKFRRRSAALDSRRIRSMVHKVAVSPIERPALPLLAATSGPQILDGYAATADLDSERMVFSRGSLSWPPDLKMLPLVIRHNINKPAGKILDLRYDADGNLHIKAQVDDPEARRLQGFSVSAARLQREHRGRRQSRARTRYCFEDGW
jgi:hypothetical protein